MGRKYLSPSAINTYLRCPRKYYLKYIKRLAEKPSIYLVRGKAVHEAIARFCGLDIEDFSDFESMKAALLGFFDNAWRAQQAQIGRLKLPEETLTEFYRESAVMLLGWLQRYRSEASNGSTRPKVEVKLFSEKHRVMGIIDAIKQKNGRVTLVDYKTSKSDEITPDIRVQMGIYALLHADKFGRAPDMVALDFLKCRVERRFKVTEKLIQNAAIICQGMHQKTASEDERDYLCKCGGWCDRDFLGAKNEA